jgi:hypothetical protein
MSSDIGSDGCSLGFEQHGLSFRVDLGPVE